jgi:hypothetical protein
VSNTAGTNSDPELKQAAVLEANTGVKVLQHSTKKPGCKEEVMAYFKAHPDSGVTRPDQIAIVGDRLSTDIMMANMMGSYGFWIKDGAVRPGFVSRSCCSKFLANDVEAREDGGQAAKLFVPKRICCAGSGSQQPVRAMSVYPLWCLVGHLQICTMMCRSLSVARIAGS